MPIRVACSCGKQLAVKDELAGKGVRCPACKNTIRVPSKSQPAQPRAAAKSELDDLFEQEGFESHSGPICPACGAKLKPGAVLCTTCGTNLQTGTKLAGHAERSAQASMHGNETLDNAARAMQADAELQKRTLDAGMPWWFLLVMFTFLVLFTTAAVAIIDAAAAGTEATGLAGQIKRMAANQAVVWGCVIAGLVLQAIPRIWITALAFTRSKGEGFLTLFVWFKFAGQLGLYPVLGLVYTLGFFTTISGLGLWAANYFGGGAG